MQDAAVRARAARTRIDKLDLRHDESPPHGVFVSVCTRKLQKRDKKRTGETRETVKGRGIKKERSRPAASQRSTAMTSKRGTSTFEELGPNGRLRRNPITACIPCIQAASSGESAPPHSSPPPLLEKNRRRAFRGVYTPLPAECQPTRGAMSLFCDNVTL